MGKLQQTTFFLYEKAKSENGIIYLDEIRTKIAEIFPEANDKIKETYLKKIRKALTDHKDIVIEGDIESFDLDGDLPDFSENSQMSANAQYTNKLLSVKRYSYDEEREKIALWKDPTISETRRTELQKEIIEHYMYIPCQIAMRYIDAYPDPDLIHEGYFGLIKALSKFDLSRGLRFSTYAVGWVKQVIWIYISNDRTIRLPAHINTDLKIIDKARFKFYKENGFFPSAEDLSDYTNLPLERVKRVIKIHPEVSSTDVIIDEERSTTVGDLIPDDSVLSPEIIYEKNEVKRILAEYVKNLPEREKYIILEHLGFNDNGQAKTFTEIGKEIAKFNVNKAGKQKELSRERVRQLFLQLISNLRSSDNASFLKDYWDEEL